MIDKNINIKISRKTRMVNLERYTIGNDRENLQGNIVFSFTDEFVDGQGRLEYKIGEEKHFIPLTKENETYYCTIKNVITIAGRIDMQLVVNEPEVDEEIPTFKSNMFYVYVETSLNAEGEAPDGYETWIEIANAKLNAMDDALEEVNNLDIDGEKEGNTTTITITRKDRTTKEFEVKDGQDAKINGYNTITIQQGTNIGISQSGSTLTINNTYDDTDIKEDIETINNNIETISNAIEEHDDAIQNIENDIDELQTDVEDLGTALDNLDVNKQNKLTAGTNITIENDVISATGSTGGIVVDIGSYQYTYDSYVLPAIAVTKAREIYATDKLGTPQVLLWTIYGNESQFKVVSSDEIAGTYSFDILVHNKYHCAYSWDSTTTGIINPTIQAGSEGGNVDDVQLNGVSILQNKVANILASTNISDTPSDSKLVTEKTIYDYIASGNDGKTRALDGVNLNNVTNTGFYSCNVCTNRPTENNGVMLVLKNGFSSDNLVQIYWTFVADVMWVRHKDLGNWKDWKQIMNSDDVDTKISNAIGNVIEGEY